VLTCACAVAGECFGHLSRLFPRPRSLPMTPLRQRFIDDLQLRNRSPRTIEVYVLHLKEFARYFGQSPDQLGLDHAHRYILYLLHDKKASWSAYNQAVSALRFFYRVRLQPGPGAGQPRGAVWPAVRGGGADAARGGSQPQAPGGADRG